MISTVLLTFVLLFCYINLPDNVAYSFDNTGKPVSFIAKQNYFYVATGFIFFFNMLFLFFKNALLKLDFNLIFPNWQWSKKPTELHNLLSSWIDSILAVVNLFLIFVVLSISNINGGKKQNLDLNYNYLLAVGSILLLIVLFYLPLRLLFSNPKSIDDHN